MILRETTVIQIYFVELDTELLFVTNLINKLYFYLGVPLRLVLDQLTETLLAGEPIHKRPWKRLGM